MEGNFGLDLEWERDIEKMDCVNDVDMNAVLSCIKDLAVEDVLWASIAAIEREGIDPFDTKISDNLLFNEGSDMEQSLPLLYTEGKYEFNKKLDFEDNLGLSDSFEEENKMMVPLDPLDKPTCSEESSTSEGIWPLTGKDILLTSIAIERGDNNLFHIKFLDSLSSNDDSDLEKPLAMLYSAEGENELNYELVFVDIAGDIEEENKMMVPVDPLAMSNYSEELYKSEDIENQPKEEEMEMLEEDTSSIDTSQQPPTNSSAPTNGDDKEEILYMVEDIVARRLSQKDRGKSYIPTCPEDYYEYRVKWEGYKPKYNTWEPYENISECTEHLEMLYEKEKKRKQPKQQPFKKTTIKTASVQRRTTWNSGASGESQVSGDNNNNNFEQFNRNKEEQQERKRKRAEQEQQTDDDDEERCVPETKRRKTVGRSSYRRSSVSTRKLPRRLTSSSRKR